MVVNNFRAGVMERMGFGYEALSKINPRIICAFGSGYGQTGPHVHKGGQDALAQAMSGVMARRSDPSVPPSVPGTAFADYAAGMHLVQGVLLALLQRASTGRGQLVSVSLLDSMIAAQMQEGTMHLMRQRELNWAAMPLSGAFETSDGALVMVGAFKTDPLRDIAAALELPALADEARFASFELQVKNKARAASICSASKISPPTPPPIGWRAAQRSRTCCARRCRPLAGDALADRARPRSTAWSCQLDLNGRSRQRAAKVRRLADAPWPTTPSS